MPIPVFTQFPDLASERIGGKIIFANDDFFAPKENLIKPGRGIFIEGKYTDRGKWMDGWESRRRRTPGHDWCIIQLGVSGKIHGLDIDTNHFLGNHPPFASVDACNMPEGLPEEMIMEEKKDPHKKPDKRIYTQGSIWEEILPKSSLKPGIRNFFKINCIEKASHLRLNIYPDGGVARFKAYGEVQKDLSELEQHAIIDLASVLNGGRVVKCSDMFFSPKENLILPGKSLSMGDGWETKRNRNPNNMDWVIIKLGFHGLIRKVIIDTSFFKGNYPDSCDLQGCFHTKAAKEITHSSIRWKKILPRLKLSADSEHVFEKEVENSGHFSHVKLNIFPDGGIARLRVMGKVWKNSSGLSGLSY